MFCNISHSDICKFVHAFVCVNVSDDIVFLSVVDSSVSPWSTELDQQVLYLSHVAPVKINKACEILSYSS